MSDQPDAVLLSRLRHDQDAFEAFYRRYVGRVTALAVRRLTNPQDVADAVAAVFLEVIESGSRFDPRRGAALPWLYGVAANIVRREHRRAARERDATRRLAARRLLDGDDLARLEEQLDAARRSQALYRAMDQLTEGERRVLELVALDGLPVVEAAGAIGIRPATARMRLTRARR